MQQLLFLSDTQFVCDGDEHGMKSFPTLILVRVLQCSYCCQLAAGRRTRLTLKMTSCSSTSAATVLSATSRGWPPSSCHWTQVAGSRSAEAPSFLPSSSFQVTIFFIFYGKKGYIRFFP